MRTIKYRLFYKKSPNKSQIRTHIVGVLLFALTIGVMIMPYAGISAALFYMTLSITFGLIPLSKRLKKFALPFGILMINAFTCSYGLSDTGTGCVPLQKVLKKIILVPYFNNAGVINSIVTGGPGTVTTAGTTTLAGSSTTFLTTFIVGQTVVVNGEGARQITAIASNTSLTVNKAFVTSTAGLAYQYFNSAFWTALTNYSLPDCKIYPLPFMKNAQNKRDASIKKQYDDNTEAIVQQGVRKFMGIIPGKDASPQLLNQLLLFRNMPLGFYGIDKDGNLIGTVNTPGWLDPIRIDENSWDPIYNQGDDKNEPEITLNFNIHTNEIDANLNVIAAADMDPNANLGNITGLLAVTGVFSNLIHSTGFTLTTATLYGSLPSPIRDKGLQIANFVGHTGTVGKVYDVTGAADLTVSSVTEHTDANGFGNGIYDVVLSGASASDVIQVNIVRNGRNYAQILNQAPVLV